MTGTRSLLAMLLAITTTADAPAQVLLPPAPIGVPVIVPNGIGFQYNSRRLRVDGFFGNGGYSAGVLAIGPSGPPILVYPPPVYLPAYGAVDRRFTVQVIEPSVLVPARRAPEIDLSGIDLDVEPAAKIWDKN